MGIEELRERLSAKRFALDDVVPLAEEAVKAIESLQRELRAASELSDSLFVDVERYCLKCCDLERELEGARRGGLAEAATICRDMGDLWRAYKDTALLNGNIDLSNAASGEVRAAEFLAKTIQDRADCQPSPSTPPKTPDAT